MWLLNQPPIEKLRRDHGFEPTQAWLTHLQRSCVRFENGGSGSFVSADGLVMTNHHVGSDMIEKLSTAERNLLEEGFYAPTREQEIACPDLELRVLWEIEEVTARVNEEVTEGLSAADAQAARRRAIARIEGESLKGTGLVSEVVTLWHGARYHLYRYRSYTDVRLVFAPEASIAFFGGDNDNFEFPRYNLDCCFFRVYENGSPLKPEHFLRWNVSGAREGDLVFVVGHPARTQRLFTLDHLKYLRDVDFPNVMDRICRREVAWTVFAARSDEHARIAQGQIFGLANSRKAFTGILEGLQSPALIKAKADAEQTLRQALADRPEGPAWLEGWAKIAAAQESMREIRNRYQALESSRGTPQLFDIARTLVRLADEQGKPDEERLAEFTQAQRSALELELFSPAPIYDAFEREATALWLAGIVELLGGDDPVVQSMLNGLSPRERAGQIVEGTDLEKVDARRSLAAGGAAAIAASADPMIQLARLIDPPARDIRKRFEDEVESAERDGYAKVAAAMFAVHGPQQYPDATFTLRLSYGTLKGYSAPGESVPAFTTLGGIYDLAKARHDQPPYQLTKRWMDGREKLKLDTPFNFVATPDIIGGNSGSPVVDAGGQVVGLIFDGNIHSLIWDIGYTDAKGRAVAVDGRGIIECLSKLYDANALVGEILGPSVGP